MWSWSTELTIIWIIYYQLIDDKQLAVVIRLFVIGVPTKRPLTSFTALPYPDRQPKMVRFISVLGATRILRTVGSLILDHCYIRYGQRNTTLTNCSRNTCTHCIRLPYTVKVE